MKNYGLICLWNSSDSDFLKYYIVAYKNLKIKSEWLIDILNDTGVPKFKKNMIVCEILYSFPNEECDEYFYLREININPYDIIWDKIYHIGLKKLNEEKL